MGRLNLDHCAMPSDAVNLFHRLGNRLNVFDHMNHSDAVEAIVWKGIGEVVQIMNDVNAFQRYNVDSNAARPFVFAAPNIKDLDCQGILPK
jgi:hypothetical protein